MTEQNPSYYLMTRQDIASLVPMSCRRILSVGCGEARTEALLMAEGREVVGIEVNPRAALEATRRITRVLAGDAEVLDLDYPAGYFDCLVYADVLEHLRSPGETLARHLRFLSSHGTVVVSVPNMRFWYAIYQLAVRGDWPYTARGIFDDTHLRVFTLKNVSRMLRDVGLLIDKVEPKYRLLERGVRGRRLAQMAAIGPLREFFAFQYLLRCRRSGA